MNQHKYRQSHLQQGIAIVTVLILLLVVSTLVVISSLLALTSRQNSRDNRYTVQALYSAEAGIEATLNQLFYTTKSKFDGLRAQSVGPKGNDKFDLCAFKLALTGTEGTDTTLTTNNKNNNEAPLCQYSWSYKSLVTDVPAVFAAPFPKLYDGATAEVTNEFALDAGLKTEYVVKITRRDSEDLSEISFDFNSSGVVKRDTEELAQRQITRTIKISGTPYSGDRFAMLTNNSNCSFCHLHIDTMKRVYDTGTTNQYDRALVGVLGTDQINWQATGHDPDSFVAGTIYSRSPLPPIYSPPGWWTGGVTQDANKVYGIQWVAGKPGKVSAGKDLTLLRSKPFLTAGSSSADVADAAAYDAKALANKNLANMKLYYNYPTSSEGEAPDEKLPDVFPTVIPDPNNNGLIEDSEWLSYVSSAPSGSLSTTTGVVFGVRRPYVDTVANFTAAVDSPVSYDPAALMDFATTADGNTTNNLGVDIGNLTRTLSGGASGLSVADFVTRWRGWLIQQALASPNNRDYIATNPSASNTGVAQVFRLKPSAGASANSGNISFATMPHILNVGTQLRCTGWTNSVVIANYRTTLTGANLQLPVPWSNTSTIINLGVAPHKAVTTTSDCEFVMPAQPGFSLAVNAARSANNRQISFASMPFSIPPNALLNCPGWTAPQTILQYRTVIDGTTTNTPIPVRSSTTIADLGSSTIHPAITNGTLCTFIFPSFTPISWGNPYSITPIGFTPRYIGRNGAAENNFWVTHNPAGTGTLTLRFCLTNCTNFGSATFQNVVITDFNKSIFPNRSNSALESLGNGLFQGNVILDAGRLTDNRAIFIDGTIKINGDLVIRGKFKGSGRFVVRGNIYVVGDVVYDCSGKACKTSDYAEPANLPKLALLAGGNIIVGEYDHPDFRTNRSQFNLINDQTYQFQNPSSANFSYRGENAAAATATAPSAAQRTPYLFYNVPGATGLNRNTDVTLGYNTTGFVPRLIGSANSRNSQRYFWSNPFGFIPAKEMDNYEDYDRSFFLSNPTTISLMPLFPSNGSLAIGTNTGVANADQIAGVGCNPSSYNLATDPRLTPTDFTGSNSTAGSAWRSSFNFGYWCTPTSLTNPQFRNGQDPRGTVANNISPANTTTAWSTQPTQNRSLDNGVGNSTGWLAGLIAPTTAYPATAATPTAFGGSFTQLGDISQTKLLKMMWLSTMEDGNRDAEPNDDATADRKGPLRTDGIFYSPHSIFALSRYYQDQQSAVTEAATQSRWIHNGSVLSAELGFLMTGNVGQTNNIFTNKNTNAIDFTPAADKGYRGPGMGIFYDNRLAGFLGIEGTDEVTIRRIGGFAQTSR